jgi:hypothetical protein
MGWKVGCEWLTFASVEKGLLRVIYKGLGLKYAGVELLNEKVKQSDLVMIRTEVEDIMFDLGAGWRKDKYKDVKRLSYTIHPWGWRAAEEAFLARYEELTQNG